MELFVCMSLLVRRSPPGEDGQGCGDQVMHALLVRIGCEGLQKMHNLLVRNGNERVSGAGGERSMPSWFKDGQEVEVMHVLLWPPG